MINFTWFMKYKSDFGTDQDHGNEMQFMCGKEWYKGYELNPGRSLGRHPLIGTNLLSINLLILQ